MFHDEAVVPFLAKHEGEGRGGVGGGREVRQKNSSTSSIKTSMMTLFCTSLITVKKQTLGNKT